jgi:HSP90 family molecular chaperone
MPAEKIRVHEKALAHLSRGLYRSPASALRELVSNAWDANATQVLVSTNYPHFAQISVHDNGDGFGKDEFKRLMAGGIGNSEKRQTTNWSPRHWSSWDCANLWGFRCHFETEEW